MCTLYLLQTHVESGIQINDIAKIQFNTPGSQVDREVSFEFELDRANKGLTINMKSPWKKAEITGEFLGYTESFV